MWNGSLVVVHAIYEWGKGTWPRFGMTRLELFYFILWMIVFLVTGRHTW